MDAVHTKLAEVVAMVESAKAVPMSASCLVHRAELLGLLTQLEQLLPETITMAREVLGDRDSVVEEGRREAEAIIVAAQAERRRLVEETEVYQEAAAEAERLREEAQVAAEAMRIEVEDYVDAKLANFEIVLTKTLSAVERGREKLSGRHELEALGDANRTVVQGGESFLDEPLQS